MLDVCCLLVFTQRVVVDEMVLLGYGLNMLTAKPGWMIDNVASVFDEVAEWRGTSEAERWHLAALCARDTMWAIAANDDPQRILDEVSPLPESTIKALRRLQEQAGWGND